MGRFERGAPDYSHYDYAAEGVRMYEQGKREGEKDKAEGKEPNHYLYVQASPGYPQARGYREGYGAVVSAGHNSTNAACIPSISIVKQEFPEANKPYRLVEIYLTSEGPRTRVCAGVFATFDEANFRRAELLSLKGAA